MESPKLIEDVNEISQNVKDYVRLQTDLLKLKITEKLSLIISYMVVGVISFIAMFFITIYVSEAFIFWYGNHVGTLEVGALIVAGFYLLCIILAVLLRRWLFVNPMISLISKLMMEDKNDGK
jgi:hypothetical protein